MYLLDVILVPVLCIFKVHFLCRLRSIATHRDHFVRRLSVRLSVRLSHSHSYVSQATHAFLGMLPCIVINLSTVIDCIQVWELAHVLVGKTNRNYFHRVLFYFVICNFRAFFLLILWPKFGYIPNGKSYLFSPIFAQK